MFQPRTLLVAALVIFAGTGVLSRCYAAEVSSPERDAAITKEIERLDADLKAAEAAELPEPVRDLVEAHRRGLDRARGAQTPDLRLYRLRGPFIGIETLSFLAREKAAWGGLDPFRKLWESRRARFEAKGPTPHGSMLVRALAEGADNRGQKLFRASLPYAKASEPWSGVYYLGEAEGNLRFRDFILRLPATDDREESTLDARRLSLAAGELERDTLKFFAGDATSPKAIPVSALLKEARELLDRKQADGATLALVEGRLELARRQGASGGAIQDPGIKGSIPDLFRKLAAVEQPPAGDVILANTIPFYQSLTITGKDRRIAPASVTVTLVRWPYT